MKPYEPSRDPRRWATADKGKLLWLRWLGGSRHRAWAVIATLTVFVPMEHAAAQDCSITARRGDWDDIQRFRRCIEEHGLDAWTPWVLHQAAASTTNPTIVRLLLQAGADPDALDDDGRTPLHWGANNSNPMVVTHLLDAGADLNARDNKGYTALHWAAAHSGNGRVVKVLLDRGADPFAESNDGRTPVHSALRYHAEPSVASRMLAAGADEHLTPLQLSALQGNVMAVDKLLAEGADPNEADRYGWGPLHFAVPLAGLKVVSALLAAGADPDARTVSGATALHLGASQATVPVVAALLSAGADPNAREKEAGESPLHYAAQLQEEDLLPVVTSLLEAGADPGSSNNYGNTPLHRALVNPAVTVPVVRALLDAGADPMAAEPVGEHAPARCRRRARRHRHHRDPAGRRGRRAGGERKRQPPRGRRLGHPRQCGLLAPRGAGGNPDTWADIQRRPQLVRRGLGGRLALRRVGRDRTSGAACSHRYGIG